MAQVPQLGHGCHNFRMLSAECGIVPFWILDFGFGNEQPA
jgi:hypothetical protein